MHIKSEQVVHYNNNACYTQHTVILRIIGNICVSMVGKIMEIVEKNNAQVCKHNSLSPTKGQYSSTKPNQTCTNSGSLVRSPLPNWSPPLVPFHQLWVYMISKRHSGKADQSTLASGGSEHV